MSGTGAQLSAALRSNAPSPATMLRAYKSFVLHAPYLTLAHFNINVAILNAFKGATRVHLVVYGLSYGGPYLALIQQLASRPGGAPNLRITGVWVVSCQLLLPLLCISLGYKSKFMITLHCSVIVTVLGCSDFLTIL
jgi:hypothetical protein